MVTRRNQLLASAPSAGSAPGGSTQLLTQRAAADWLGLSVRTLQNLDQTGDGPLRVQLTDRRIAYRLADLEAWINSRVVTSTSEATVARTKRAGRAA